MAKTALVTGAGTGIGLQLSMALLAGNGEMQLIAVGRHGDSLSALTAIYPERVVALTADVATEEGRRSIADRLATYPQLDYLVHGAATVQPIASMKQLVVGDWRYAMQTNVEAPLFLTQLLLDKCHRSRVLFFTSESNVQPVQGASAYCVSKVAQQMVYECFKTEISGEQAIFAMVSPGLVDTPMQAVIRQADPEILPAAAQLLQLYRDKQLLTADTVARFLSWLLLVVDDANFSANTWDIYQEHHHRHWMIDK